MEAKIMIEYDGKKYALKTDIDYFDTLSACRQVDLLLRSVEYTLKNEIMGAKEVK